MNKKELAEQIAENIKAIISETCPIIPEGATPMQAALILNTCLNKILKHSLTARDSAAAIIEAMGVQTGMRWVKASERLPEVKEKWYWCKIERLDFKGAFYFNRYGQFTTLIENKYDNEEIQWLEETPAIAE